MGSTRQTFPILVFLFVWGCSSATPPSVSTTDASSQNEPDQKMDRVHLQIYGDKDLEWELTAPEARGYSKRNVMLADDLTIVLFKNGEKSTNLTADEGVVITDEKKPNQTGPIIENVEGLELKSGDMVLKGNVVAISTDGAKLETDWLWFQKTFELITSTAPVKLTRPDSITTGVGLKAKQDLSSVEIYDQTVVIKGTENLDEKL